MVSLHIVVQFSTLHGDFLKDWHDRSLFEDPPARRSANPCQDLNQGDARNHSDSIPSSPKGHVRKLLTHHFYHGGFVTKAPNQIHRPGPYLGLLTRATTK